MLVTELKADTFVLFAVVYLRQTNRLLHRGPTTAATNSHTYPCESRPSASPNVNQIRKNLEAAENIFELLARQINKAVKYLLSTTTDFKDRK